MPRDPENRDSSISTKANRRSLRETYDRFETDYYFKAFKRFPTKYWHAKRLELLQSLLGNIREKRVLDLGCNVGIIANLLVEKGAEVTGVDISAPTLNLGHNFHQRVTFIRADAQNLPFKENSFDRVICIEVLEHVPKPQHLIDRALQVLKPGGSFIAIVPNDDSLLFKLLWWAWQKTGGRKWIGLHIHIYNPISLRYMLSDFRVEAVESCLNGMLFGIRAYKEREYPDATYITQVCKSLAYVDRASIIDRHSS